MTVEYTLLNGNLNNERKMRNFRYGSTFPSKVGLIMVMCIFITIIIIFIMTNSPSNFISKSRRPEIRQLFSVNVTNLTLQIQCDFTHKLEVLYERVLQHNPTLEVINELRDFMSGYECILPSEKQSKTHIKQGNEILDVCEEKYMGSRKSSKYFFSKGFYSESCKNVRPLENVISIGLDFTDCLPFCIQILKTILKQIEVIYPKLTVLIATPNNSSLDRFKFKGINLQEFNFSKTYTSGAIWNNLIEHVRTPYFFIGRNLIDIMWHTQLDRHIRVFQALTNVMVVGGAVRTLYGNWSADCYQTTMINYVYHYQEGYYRSRNECMFCNYLNGPFSARVESLYDYRFDEKLSGNSIFVDFFQRLKEDEKFAVSCPDVMNFVNDIQVTNNRDEWLGFAKKYEINKILLVNGTFIFFSCEELKQSCTALTVTKSYMLPLCCQQKIKDAVEIVTKYLDKYNVAYWIIDGTILGAVKLQGPLPWDVDIDIVYDAKDYHFIVKSENFWKDQGFKIQFDKPGPKVNGLQEARTRLYFNNMYIEIFSTIDAKNYSDSRYNSTIMKFDKIYVKAPLNPGLVSRNSYGKECLKHSQSWLLVNKKMWDNYDAGYFLHCKKPKHHACLDHFIADGNIFFKVP